MKGFLLLLLMLSACTTIPTGNHQLAQRSRGALAVSHGKPIYLKVHRYPYQKASGDIQGEHDVYLLMGYEKFRFDEVIGVNLKRTSPQKETGSPSGTGQ